MKYDRVIINFTQSCNMQCPFCYIPFDNEKINLRTFTEVLDHSAELGVKTITFGGGDPYAYKEFGRVLEYAKALKFQIQVDTNGLCMKEKDIEQLVGCASMLSLPLDGSTPEMQHAMRQSARNNHAKVLELLGALRDKPITLKVNTVASQINADDIPNICDLLSQYRINRWSVYQFWPINTTEQTNRDYGLSDERFDGLVRTIKEKPLAFIFEPGPVRERAGTYLLVTPNGKTYTGKLGNSKTIFLPSFLSDAWQKPIEEVIQTTVRERVRNRYAL